MAKNKNVWLNVLLAIAGGISGFLYWKLIGCTSGTCPMESIWYLLTITGMALGYMFCDLTGSLIGRRAIENE